MTVPADGHPGGVDDTTPLGVVRRVFDSHRTRDTAALVSLLHPRVEWYEAQGHPYARTRPWRGPEEVVREVVEHVNQDWDGYATQVHQMVPAGETVVVLGRYTGRYRRTGLELDAEMCTLYTVRDGRIILWRQFTDTEQFNRVMGLTVPAGAKG